jgi:HlyD family secretion protein
VVDAFPGREFKGEVTQIRYSPTSDQGVVTYAAVVDVSNPELLLRPGMTATVTIRTREAKRVLATKNAALRFRPLPERDEEGKPKPTKPLAKLEHGEARLFLLGGGPVTDPGLVPQVVSTGLTDGIWTQIEAGKLKPGVEVVIDQRETSARRGFRLF